MLMGGTPKAPGPLAGPDDWADTSTQLCTEHPYWYGAPWGFSSEVVQGALQKPLQALD